MSDTKPKSTDLTALTSAIALVADAVTDTLVAVEPGQSIFGKLLDYENLVGDLENLLPQIGNVPAEVSALEPADVVTLVQTLVTDLGITDVKANAILAASIALLNHILTVILPDVTALITAINSVDPVPAPVAK